MRSTGRERWERSASRTTGTANRFPTGRHGRGILPKSFLPAYGLSSHRFFPVIFTLSLPGEVSRETAHEKPPTGSSRSPKKSPVLPRDGGQGNSDPHSPNRSGEPPSTPETSRFTAAARGAGAQPPDL